MFQFLVLVVAAATSPSEALALSSPRRNQYIYRAISGEQEDFDPDVSKRFKIVTCSATSCAAKRELLSLDQYATFSAFWERIQDRGVEVSVEETSCLGSCEKAPCVAVEHDDFEGTVALEGMDSSEFSDRVFHRVIDDGDADRVWRIVENAIRATAIQDDDGL